MEVAQRHDGVGQYGFGQHYSKMAPPSSFPNFGHDRRPPMEDHAEPMWPVPRNQPQLPQGSALDRFPNSFSQPDLARHQGHQGNYTYEGASSAVRNPVVYSQPAQLPWGLAGQSNEYAEYPTASFMPPMGQRGQPPVHGQSPYLGSSTNGTYNDSALHAGSDAFPKSMNGPSSAIGGPYNHAAETLWPLGPNSLDAFAGIPAPTRLVLTTADKGKMKARSSLPPPKQFKCSACDAIFSRNHDLKRHARIHLAVKPFPCGYCDKAFSRKDALKRHVLVKGCGIGNKKGDNRKRAATLSKLEHSEGENTSRAPYDGGSSESRLRDFSGFRDDLHYQGQQQQQQQGLQGDASNPRSFPGRIDAPWAPSLPDAPNSSANLNAEYGSSRLSVSEAPHSSSLPSFGTQQHSHQYPTLLGQDALQQSQRPQLAGGLVNAFTSPEGNSPSSPSSTHSKHVMGGLMPIKGEDSEQQLSRPGSGKMLNAAAYPAQSYPLTGGVDGSLYANTNMGAGPVANEPGSGFAGFDGQGKDRFGPGSYPSAPMISPSLSGAGDHKPGHLRNVQDIKRAQQPFGSYFGDNTAN